MNSVFEVIVVVVLTVLYALAWHNEPPRQDASRQRRNQR